jgi:regulator of replication initiation timing
MDNAIVRYELNELNKQLAIEQARMKTRLAEQNKINAARLEKQKIEDQKRKAGYRQANETCIFRTEQARTNNSQQNRLYRDQACALVNQFR